MVRQTVTQATAISMFMNILYVHIIDHMGFYVCAMKCVHTHRTSCFKAHPRRLGYVQLIPYPNGLQQNKRQEWESNLCPSASTGSQVLLTTPRLTVPDIDHLYRSILTSHLHLSVVTERFKERDYRCLDMNAPFIDISFNYNYSVLLHAWLFTFNQYKQC